MARFAFRQSRSSQRSIRTGGDSANPGPPGGRGEQPLDDLEHIWALPLFLWLIAQLAGLALAATRVPLAAAYPQPAELQAVRVLLAIQFAWAAMIFPVLFRNWRMILASICAAWVMLVMAAALAAWSLEQVIPAGCFLTLWLIALAAWRGAFKSPAHQLLASSLACVYGIGGALIWYLHLELESGKGSLPHAVYGPLLIVLSDPRHPSVSGWWTLAMIAGVGILVRIARQVRLRKSRTLDSLE